LFISFCGTPLTLSRNISAAGSHDCTFLLYSYVDLPELAVAGCVRRSVGQRINQPQLCCYALIDAAKLVFTRDYEDRPGALFSKLLDLAMSRKAWL
jgi:hypothetical protein